MPMFDASAMLWSFLLSLVGNATVIAALAFVGQGIFKNILDKNTKQFEIELRAKADSEIEKIRSNLQRDIESYRNQLKKSEFLFQREFEAAVDFARLFEDFSPKATRPDMEWEDALEVIADHFAATQGQIRDYRIKHGPALEPDERVLLERAMNASISGEMDMAVGGFDPQVGESANDLYETLLKFRDGLFERVRKQSSL